MALLSDGSSDSTGPPDRQTLRLLDRTFASDPLTVETAFDPDPYEPRLLRVFHDGDRYPARVTAAKLDVRWFTTGDFSFHYVEDIDDGDRWECHWDRHPNDHTDRLHVHEPPDAGDGTGLSLPSLHPLDVSSTVLTAIAVRIETLWADSQ
ncbi:hypothetical protein [Halobaculum sp. EA56]|uniref:hypothetical protein n=1 Tax=Halobaculum sp. EA56 TaxID=3421648 RepID=UPI003EBDF86C